MPDKKYNRKEFLNLFRPSTHSENIDKHGQIEETVKLSQEKEIFLNEYIVWLNEFESFLADRVEGTFNVEQNKKIMFIASKIEEKKVLLQEYMKDPLFSDKFKKLSKNITDKI